MPPPNLRLAEYGPSSTMPTPTNRRDQHVDIEELLGIDGIATACSPSAASAAGRLGPAPMDLLKRYHSVTVRAERGEALC
jgi:hypothetical protein